MSTKEAADILGIDFMSVSRLIRRNLLKGEKFGPVWMVERASVEAYAAKVKGKSKFDPRRGKSES